MGRIEEGNSSQFDARKVYAIEFTMAAQVAEEFRFAAPEVKVEPPLDEVSSTHDVRVTIDYGIIEGDSAVYEPFRRLARNAIRHTDDLLNTDRRLRIDDPSFADALHERLSREARQIASAR